MPLDLWALLATLALAFFNIGLSSILTLLQLGPAYILSPRDEQREPKGLAGRVARAYKNLLENFAQFLAAIALVHFTGTNGELTVLGAWMFFSGRFFYLPAYVFGPPGLRPLFWMVAQTGVLIILADLFVGAS